MKNLPVGNSLSFKAVKTIGIDLGARGSRRVETTNNNDIFTKTEVKPQYDPSKIALCTAAGLGAVFSIFAAFKKGAGKLVRGGAIATTAAAAGAVLYNHFSDKIVRKTQTLADKSTNEYYEHYRFGKLFKVEGTHRDIDHKDERYDTKYDKQYVQYYDKSGNITREENLLNFKNESVIKEIVDYVYENGRLAKKLINSSDQDFDNQIITYKYDTQGRLAQEEITSQQDGKVIETVKYKYNVNGNVTRQENVKAGYCKTTVTEYTNDTRNLRARVTTTVDELGDRKDKTIVEEYSYYNDGTYKEIKVNTKTKNSTVERIKLYNPDGSYIEKTSSKEDGILEESECHYDKKGNMILSETTKQNSEGEVFETSKIAYIYDKKGGRSKLERTTVDLKNKKTTRMITYYDEDGELLKSEGETITSENKIKVVDLHDKKGIIEVIKEVTTPDGKTLETDKKKYTYDADGKKTGQGICTEADGKKHEYKEIYDTGGTMLEEQGVTTFADGGTNTYTIKLNSDGTKTETGTYKFKDGRIKEYTEDKGVFDKILSESFKILYPDGKVEMFDAKYEYDSKFNVAREERVTKDKEGKEEKTVKENAYTFNDKEDAIKLETTTTKQDGTVEKEVTESDYTYKIVEPTKFSDTVISLPAMPRMDTEKRKVTHADGKVDEYDIKYEYYPREGQRIEKGVMKCSDGKTHTYETKAEGQGGSYRNIQEKGTTVFPDGGRNEYRIDFEHGVYLSEAKTEKGHSTFVNGDTKDYTEEYDRNGRKIKEEYTIKHKDGTSETKKKVLEQGELKEVPATN